nr:MAG TPA: hypothetical protein [Caudoviricetes sp.]
MEIVNENERIACPVGETVLVIEHYLFRTLCFKAIGTMGFMVHNGKRLILNLPHPSLPD